MPGYLWRPVAGAAGLYRAPADVGRSRRVSAFARDWQRRSALRLDRGSAIQIPRHRSVWLPGDRAGHRLLEFIDPGDRKLGPVGARRTWEGNKRKADGD